MEIFEQGFPPAARAGTNAVEFRIKRIRQFLGVRVAGAARSAEHGGRGGAQVLPEVSDKKFPGVLDPFGARAGERQILQVQQPQVRFDLAWIGVRTGEPLGGAAPQALGERFLGQSPPRAHRIRVQLCSEARVLRQEWIERREGRFFGHEFGWLPLIRCIIADPGLPERQGG